MVIAAFVYLPDEVQPAQGRCLGTGSAADPRYHGGNPRLLAIGAVLIGLVLASAIQLLTGYFTETNRRPVREIGESSLTGARDRDPVRYLGRASSPPSTRRC